MEEVYKLVKTGSCNLSPNNKTRLGTGWAPSRLKIFPRMTGWVGAIVCASVTLWEFTGQSVYQNLSTWFLHGKFDVAMQRTNHKRFCRSTPITHIDEQHVQKAVVEIYVDWSMFNSDLRSENSCNTTWSSHTKQTLANSLSSKPRRAESSSGWRRSECLQSKNCFSVTFPEHTEHKSCSDFVFFFFLAPSQSWRSERCAVLLLLSHKYVECCTAVLLRHTLFCFTFFLLLCRNQSGKLAQKLNRLTVSVSIGKANIYKLTRVFSLRFISCLQDAEYISIKQRSKRFLLLFKHVLISNI